MSRISATNEAPGAPPLRAVPIGVARCADAQAPRLWPMLADRVLDRLANQFGHGDPSLGGHCAQALEEILRQ